MKGSYVRKDAKRANNAFAQACNLNYGEACFLLALDHEVGIESPQNITKAKEFYSKACDLGLKDACTGYANLVD